MLSDLVKIKPRSNEQTKLLLQENEKKAKVLFI